MRALVSFPDPVNEVAARLVAGAVALLAIATLATGQTWFVAVLAVGFLLRVLSGPRFSPLGLLATKLVVPRLNAPAKLVSGPPKRFAQAMGLTFTATAAVLTLGFGLDTAAEVLLGLIVVAATLESVFAICLGCIAFGGLMRIGVIPAEVCERCNDIWGGRAPAG